MKLSESNEHGSKVSAIAVDINVSVKGVASWATVFVHREPNYCVQYSNVSKASVGRVQRAQVAMLERMEAQRDRATM